MSDLDGDEAGRSEFWNQAPSRYGSSATKLRSSCCWTGLSNYMPIQVARFWVVPIAVKLPTRATEKQLANDSRRMRLFPETTADEHNHSALAPKLNRGKVGFRQVTW